MDRGRAYENRLALERGMRKQPFSGAGIFKEDLVGDHEVVQAKSTGNGKSYTLLREDIRQVCLYAMRTGKKLGAIFLEWDSDEYVILKRSDYEAFICLEPPAVVCGKCCTTLPGDLVLCKDCKNDKA